MRQYKDIVLAVRIRHGKCHHIMRVLPEIRIQLHIFCKIVHPSHIPFQAESKTVILRGPCYLRPCGRLFRDHDSALISSQNNGVQMLKELDRLKVLISAIFICDPLTVLLSVIQIKH